MALPRLHGERDIVERAVLDQQFGDLERTRDSPPHARGRRQAPDVVPVEMNVAGIGLYLAHELADERGLARAVGADERVDFARAHVERHDRPSR